MNDETLKQRLLARRVIAANGCWIWPGAKNNKGYSQIRFNCKCLLVHRASYEVFNGPTGNLDVLHKCDTPLCWNPDHLFLGTHLQNMRDMWAKGRARPRKFDVGVGHPMAKLNDEKVLKIRKQISNGLTAIEIAGNFGVCQTTIKNIRSGKIWKHVITPLASKSELIPTLDLTSGV